MKAAPLIGVSHHRFSTSRGEATTLVAFHSYPLHCKCRLNPQSLHSEDIQKHYGCGQLYGEVKQDELYFPTTHGGITFGDGEPCLRSDFTDESRQLCGQEWQLSVETSLSVAQENTEKLVPVVDSYIINVKDTNNAVYQKYTGRDNEKVLHNPQYLIDHGKDEQIIVRTPVIPTYNAENGVDYSIRLPKGMRIAQFDRSTYKTSNNCQP